MPQVLKPSPNPSLSNELEVLSEVAAKLALLNLTWEQLPPSFQRAIADLRQRPSWAAAVTALQNLQSLTPSPVGCPGNPFLMGPMSVEEVRTETAALNRRISPEVEVENRRRVDQIARKMGD